MSLFASIISKVSFSSVKPRNRSVLLIIFLLSLFSSMTQAQRKMCDLKLDEKNYAFKDGEELTYVANYSWAFISTDVGEASFTLSRFVTDQVPYFFVEVKAKTYKFYDKVFMVRDVYMSRFKAETMQPIYFHRNINEGGYVKRNTYNFDWDNMKIKSTTQRKTNTPTDTLLPLTYCTFDLLTLIYYSRNLDYGFVKEGDKFPFTFAIDNDVYNIKYRYIKKETINVKGFGNIRCMKFAVEVVAGDVFTGKDEVLLWVSDDKNRLPVRAESPIIVGRVRAHLVKAKNTLLPVGSN